MPRAVVFDVGCVLIQWDVYALYRKLLPNDAAITAFIDEVDLFAHNLEFDRGKPFADGVRELSAAFPHHAALIRAFDERWEETVTGPIQGTVDILEALKQDGVPLYAITNFASEKWALTSKRFPFLVSSFIDVVVSGDEGTIKPDREIFERLLQRNALSAENCLFIDDTEKNVAGAKAVGMDGVQFKSPQQLRYDLEARGLLKEGV